MTISERIEAAQRERRVLARVCRAACRLDQAERERTWALVARVGRDTDKLAAEALNPRDSGARWCAGWLLARAGSPVSRTALATPDNRYYARCGQ